MTRRTSGRQASEQTSRWRPRHKYILDNSLNPRLAEALRLAGWDINSVNEEFSADPRDSIEDDTIIERCAATGRAWITRDSEARREHALALSHHQTSVLWVNAPKGGTSTAYDHAILVAALLQFDQELTRAEGRGRIHAKIGSTLHAKLQIISRGGRRDKAGQSG